MTRGKPRGHPKGKRLRLGLIARPDAPDRVEVAERVLKEVGSRAEVVVHEHAAKALRMKGRPFSEMDVDVMVTVGGDGTILWTLQHHDAPVFGVNLGELGFLTEVDPEHLAEGLDRLLGGDYTVEDRARVATTVNGQRLPDAVNEAVVRTARASKMLHLVIRLDGHEMERIRCDGLILSTPTGSTSYAMSAGGPIVDPRLAALLLVPLAAFKIGTRPVVLPPEARLTVTLTSPVKDAVLAIDGQHEAPVGEGDELAFHLSERRARFVRFGEHFYRRLRERLIL